MTSPIHPLCLLMGLISHTLDSYAITSRWKAEGGWNQLRALVRDTQKPFYYATVSFHHPSIESRFPGHRLYPIRADLEHFVRALLALEGYSYQGAVTNSGLTTLTGVTPTLSGHKHLEDIARLSSHLTTLGWQPGLEHDEDFQSSLTSLVSKGMPSCV